MPPEAKVRQVPQGTEDELKEPLKAYQDAFRILLKSRGIQREPIERVGFELGIEDEPSVTNLPGVDAIVIKLYEGMQGHNATGIGIGRVLFRESGVVVTTESRVLPEYADQFFTPTVHSDAPNMVSKKVEFDFEEDSMKYQTLPRRSALMVPKGKGYVNMSESHAVAIEEGVIEGFTRHMQRLAESKSTKLSLALLPKKHF